MKKKNERITICLFLIAVIAASVAGWAIRDLQLATFVRNAQETEAYNYYYWMTEGILRAFEYGKTEREHGNMRLHAEVIYWDLCYDSDADFQDSDWSALEKTLDEIRRSKHTTYVTHVSVAQFHFSQARNPIVREFNEH